MAVKSVKDNYMTEQEFVKFLADQVEENNSVEAFCATLKGRGHMIFAPHYIQSIISGAESVGADIAKAMGYKKQTLFVKREK